MSTRRINLALQITTVLTAAAAIGSLAAGLLLPLSLPEIPVQSKMPMLAVGDDSPPQTLAAFAPLFSRSLQPSSPAQSVSATPAEVAAMSEAAAPISQLSLVGTIGDSLALIKGPDGTVGIVEVGDDVDGSSVLAIKPSQCEMRVNGKLTMLRMPPPPNDSIVLPAQ